MMMIIIKSCIHNCSCSASVHVRIMLCTTTTTFLLCCFKHFQSRVCCSCNLGKNYEEEEEAVIGILINYPHKHTDTQ